MGTTTNATIAWGIDLGEDLPECLMADDDDDDFDVYEAFEGLDLGGVELQIHCSDRCPEYIVCAAGSDTVAPRGLPATIDSLEVKSEWRTAMAAAIGRLDLDDQPAWLLFSYWG